ncbi:MAG: hypothetical protein AB8H12_14075 [Lewinella sp.]
MSLTPNTLLLRRHLVAVPTATGTADRRMVGTLLSNLAYFGYVPSVTLLEKLQTIGSDGLVTFWNDLEPALKTASGEDRKIGDTIVYQNFPREVLEMTEADYWFRQVLMYLGVHREAVREAPAARPALFEAGKLTVLRAADDGSLSGIQDALLAKPSVWIPIEQEEIDWFVANGYAPDTSLIGFKENLVYAGTKCLEAGLPFVLTTTTDILRFYAGLSAGDISLNTNTKFKSLSRSRRRLLLEMLEQAPDLEEGLIRHRNKWVRALHALHVGDYGKIFPKAWKAAKVLREGGKFATFNGKVEALLMAKDPAVLTLLQSRPGDFSRRLVHLLHTFGAEAVTAFLEVVPKLPTMTLLRLEKVIDRYNITTYRTFAPLGNWTKLQVQERKVEEYLEGSWMDGITGALRAEVLVRVKAKFPQGVNPDPATAKIKLPTNNADGALPYGRGTEFALPDNVKFIRTATYWKATTGTCWMDNGWNFFDEDWAAVDSIAWNHTDALKPAAVFSGDPVNSQNSEGTAGQLIDLYPDKLAARGIRYGVWSILSYSRIPFDGVEEVMGLMQLGEKPEAGKLIEPSRCQFTFKVTGSSLTRYVCYVDFIDRKIVYLDAGLYGNVGSAKANETSLGEKMPAMLDYLATLPSVHDVFRDVSLEVEGLPVRYSDADVYIDTEKAYVFQPENEANNFKGIALEDLLP